MYLKIYPTVYVGRLMRASLRLNGRFVFWKNTLTRLDFTQVKSENTYFTDISQIKSKS